MTRNHKGFTIVEVVIVLAIVVLIGLIGWRVWMANQTAGDTDQTDTTQSTEAPAINSNEDLDQADQVLDETNLEGTESQQLDTETSF